MGRRRPALLIGSQSTMNSLRLRRPRLQTMPMPRRSSTRSLTQHSMHALKILPSVAQPILTLSNLELSPATLVTGTEVDTQVHTDTMPRTDTMPHTDTTVLVQAQPSASRLVAATGGIKPAAARGGPNADATTTARGCE